MKAPVLPRRTIVLLLLLGVVLMGSVAWLLGQRAPSPPPVSVGRKLMLPRARPQEPEIVRVPPREMRTVVRQDGLLKPDRRLVLAFEEVASLTGRASEGGAKVSSADRRWTIDAGGGVSATLPTIPGFFETLDALRDAAGRSLTATGGKNLSPAESRRLRELASDPFGDSTLRAVREIDRLWASGFSRSELLDLASRAFVTIALQTVDTLEMGDAIGGRALGLLALAEAAAKKRFLDREVLLARAIGYPGEARVFARNLPEREPARLFLLGADRLLKALAEDAKAPPLVRYLYVLDFGEQADTVQVEDWLRAHRVLRTEDPAVIGATLSCKDSFDYAVEANSTLMMLGWVEAGAKDSRPGPGMLASFERALASRKHENGRFLDDAVAAGHTRAIFYSGLCGVGSFYLDSLSSGPAAGQFIDYLKEAEPGPGAEFRRWFGNLVAEKNGEIRAERLVDDLESLPSLGQAAIRRTGTRLREALYATSSAKPKAAAILERILDSRPENDYLFSTMCRQSLMHPVASDQYYRASVERAGKKGALQDTWLAYQAQDAVRLRAISSDPAMSAYAGVWAVTYLKKLGVLSPEEIRASLLGILSRKPDTWSALRAIRLLWEDGFLVEGETFLRLWLGAHPDEHVLTRSNYAGRLEHVLFLQGRYEDAWRVIEPFVSTYQANALWAGAEALEGLGRHAEALRMSTDMLERYPDSGVTRADHAQLLWRQSRYEEAAKPLVDARHPIDPQTWGDYIAPRFFEAFEKRSRDDTLKAFDAMIRAGVNPWFLFSFAEPFATHKQYDTAIALLDNVCKSKNERIDGYLWAYRFRKLGRGADAANEWFRSEVVRSKSASWVGDTAFDSREFELLWLLPASNEVWMLRAQAAAFEGGVEEARQKQLIEHFRDPKTPEPDALYGRYLLGLETDDRLFESATDARRRCDAAFLLGMRAVGEKRLEDACDWFRVCLKAGLAAWPSYKHAEACLKTWDTRRFGVRGGADIP